MDAYRLLFRIQNPNNGAPCIQPGIDFSRRPRRFGRPATTLRQPNPAPLAKSRPLARALEHYPVQQTQHPEREPYPDCSPGENQFPHRTPFPSHADRHTRPAAHLTSLQSSHAAGRLVTSPEIPPPQARTARPYRAAWPNARLRLPEPWYSYAIQAFFRLVSSARSFMSERMSTSSVRATHSRRSAAL